MTSIPQNLRYLPHTLETHYHAVKTYQNGDTVALICRRYKVSKASLRRWNKRFDGTRESLKDRSHRPLDLLYQELRIEHKLIRPRTPRHNGKVEYSHTNDNRPF